MTIMQKCKHAGCFSESLPAPNALCIDLYCGLGGWAEGFIAEGWNVIGFDIEWKPYPGLFVMQDVLTLHGSQFKDASIIVGSSPCQEFSYRAMPWTRAKALPPPYSGMELFEAQFRIQREACEAAGRYIPIVVENVRAAESWVGPARWHFGPYYLWGDIPALMPLSARPKQIGTWFYHTLGARAFSAHSKQRKAWTAQIAKIPFPLARHIARAYLPMGATT